VQFRIGDKSASVAVSSDLEAEIRRVLATVQDVTLAEMTKAAEDVAAAARATAPVKTGSLRGGIDTYTRVNVQTGEIAVGITQTDPDAQGYQFFVKYSRRPDRVPSGGVPGKSFQVEKIRKPMTAAGKALADRIRERMGAMR